MNIGDLVMINCEPFAYAWIVSQPKGHRVMGKLFFGEPVIVLGVDMHRNVDCFSRLGRVTFSASVLILVTP